MVGDNYGVVHDVAFNSGQLYVVHVNPEDNKLEIDCPEMEEDIQVSDLNKQYDSLSELYT